MVEHSPKILASDKKKKKAMIITAIIVITVVLPLKLYMCKLGCIQLVSLSWLFQNLHNECF